MVNKHGSWLHQEGDQCNRLGGCANPLSSSIAAKEDDCCRNIDEILGHENGCPHIDLEELRLKAAGTVQGEPRWVNERTAERDQ